MEQLAPHTVDERVIALMIHRTGAVKQLIRHIESTNMLEGWANQQIFIAAKKILEAAPKTQQLAPDIIMEHLKQMGSYEKIGDAEFKRLMEITDDNARDRTAVNAVIKMITDRHEKKKFEKLADEYQAETDSEKKEELRKKLGEASRYGEKKKAEGKVLSVEDWMEELKTVEVPPDCIPTGFEILDEMLGGGFIKGNYHIVASPTGSGKTILMLSMWKHLLESNIKSVYINYEIPRDLFMKYMFAQLTGCNVYFKDISPQDLADAKLCFAEKIEKLYEEDMLLIADPRSGSSTMWHDLEEMIRELVEDRGAECIWFDTINSIHAATKKGQDLRWNEYESIAMSAEYLCQELNVPIIFSAQMDRDAVRKDGDKTPNIGDVAGSKVLTEKAASVVHLHRVDLIDKTKIIDYSELHITKNRVIGQELGTKPIRVKYDARHKSLYELPKDQQETEKTIVMDEGFEGTFISPAVPGVRRHPTLQYASEEKL